MFMCIVSSSNDLARDKDVIPNLKFFDFIFTQGKIKVINRHGADFYDYYYKLNDSESAIAQNYLKLLIIYTKLYIMV